MMPDQISVCEFLSETTEDYNSPTTSSFTTRLQSCRNTVSILEEALDQDRSSLQKVKKSVKSIYSSGTEHAGNQESFSQALERLGGNNPELGAAFVKFSCLVKDLASLLKNLLQSLSHNVVFTLDSLLKGDLKGVKGDLKKPFDKAWKDYETKLSKIEKEKREHAKQHGMIRTEITGAEVAEEMEKERRLFQLQMCEYLIKVNEIKTKKGVDLLQNLIKYYHAQCNFFQDGLNTADKLKQYIEKLAADLFNIKQSQDEEKKQLTTLRDLIKSCLQLDQREVLNVGGGANRCRYSTRGDSQSKQTGYSMHQLQGNKEFGSEKRGYLLKKSDGLRKVWQRRKCSVKSCTLTIAHATSNRQPVRLNLLTCQVKPSAEDKKCFDLISHNRTYHFQAEDESDWVSVLTNSKEEALNVAFQGGGQSSGVEEEELTKSIIDEVLRSPGNDTCCDCGAADPRWISTNLGVLTCIECSGIHREMGVHVSRIQSLELDKLGTSELLLAKNVGNCSFNDIMEAGLSSLKPTPSSDMTARKEFINAKYIDRKFVRRTVSMATSGLEELCEAVQSRDLLSIIQLYAEGVELLQPLPEPGQEAGETALHHCVRTADTSSLHLVDFLVQNSGNLDGQTDGGNTALHYCCLYNKPQCVKLLLRGKPDLHISKNTHTHTHTHTHTFCLVEAVSGRFNPHVHVEYDWNLRLDELDESDDELDDKPSPVKKERSLRPQSFCPTSSSSSQDKLSLPASFIPPHRDKLRLSYGAFANPVYSTSSDNPPSPGPDTSGPSPAARSQGKGSEWTPPPGSRSKFEGIQQQQSTTSSNTKSTLGPRVLPKLPQKVALRKIDTVHLPSVDKSSPPPDVLHKPSSSSQPDPQKSPPFIDASPKPSPTQVDSTQRAPVAEKPQLSDLPPKPHLSDLPPKPLLRDLPPKPQITDLPPKPTLRDRPRHTPVATETQGSKMAVVAESQSSDLQGETSPRLVADCDDELPPSAMETPVPLPRKINSVKNKIRRVKTIYDCQADNDDELTFTEGEVIIVTGEEDPEWWIGHIEGQPERRGVFPMSFVHNLCD
uniref:ArfGAP with SH3 domain, ankyrin repeat and PH domain 1a n=1 Tax=Sparus aurata TaxID=8175 RepID=A0A671Z523_SPAAU